MAAPERVREITVALSHPALVHADWADGWQVNLIQPFANGRAAAQSIMRAFPVWTGPLLALRQLMVLPLGLKGAGAHHAGRDMLGIFPVISQTADQLVAGFDDKHLDFRIVVDIAPEAVGQTVTLSTLIRRHNWAGRVYLQAVLPFHRAIIKGALGRLAAEKHDVMKPQSN
jgi:Protein of unknown function (DUF2867)